MSGTGRYVFHGRTFDDGAALTEWLIIDGYASPAARDMDVDVLIQALVDQCFLDERDAPRKVA